MSSFPMIFPLILLLQISLSNGIPFSMDKVEMEREFHFNFRNLKRTYKMAVPRDDPCPEGTDILIMILSRRNGINERNAIRKTWAADKLPNQVVRFVIGQAASSSISLDIYRNGKTEDEDMLEQGGGEGEPPAADVEEAELGQEQQRHGDLVFYGMPDGYYNLPLKVLAIFQWQQAFCSTAKFLLKIDDDLVVDLDRLAFWLKHRYEPILEHYPKAAFGQMVAFWEKGGIPHRAIVVRNQSEKWYMPEADYAANLYPPYLNGPSYLLSSAAVSAILNQTAKVPFLRFEDLLYTGILAEKANVSLFGHESTFQIICNKLSCDVKYHLLGDNFISKLVQQLGSGKRIKPNGTIEFAPEAEDEPKYPVFTGQRHCQPIACDQDENLEQLNAKVNIKDEEEDAKEADGMNICEAALNDNCAHGVPKLTIWCRSTMETLEDYQRNYDKLRALKCK